MHCGYVLLRGLGVGGHWHVAVLALTSARDRVTGLASFFFSCERRRIVFFELLHQSVR